VSGKGIRLSLRFTLGTSEEGEEFKRPKGDELPIMV
jgi:hypothetical protein